MSHLRFGTSPIKSTYLIHKANFVACHNPSYVRKYNMVQELVDGGTFLLNCRGGIWKVLRNTYRDRLRSSSLTTTSNSTPSTVLRSVLRPAMGPTRINTILQSAFFKLTGIIPAEKANRADERLLQRLLTDVKVRTLL